MIQCSKCHKLLVVVGSEIKFVRYAGSQVRQPDGSVRELPPGKTGLVVVLARYCPECTPKDDVVVQGLILSSPERGKRTGETYPRPLSY